MLALVPVGAHSKVLVTVHNKALVQVREQVPVQVQVPALEQEPVQAQEAGGRSQGHQPVLVQVQVLVQASRRREQRTKEPRC